jgi:hypothetical protein
MVPVMDHGSPKWRDSPNRLFLRFGLENCECIPITLCVFNCCFLRRELDTHVRQWVPRTCPTHQWICPPILARKLLELNTPHLRETSTTLLGRNSFQKNSAGHVVTRHVTRAKGEHRNETVSETSQEKTKTKFLVYVSFR